MSGKQSLDTIKQIAKRLYETNIFDRTLAKVQIISAENGKCRAEFKVEPEHTNIGGTLHGGCSATLVDSISTFALMTYGRKVPGVSVDMHITYLKAAHLGEEIVVEADTIRAGKTLAFLDVTIKNKKTGNTLVTGSHTKYIA